MASLMRELAALRKGKDKEDMHHLVVEKSARSEYMQRPNLAMRGPNLRSGSDVEDAASIEQQRARLLSALPPPPVPNIPGIGSQGDAKQLMLARAADLQRLSLPPQLPLQQSQAPSQLDARHDRRGVVAYKSRRPPPAAQPFGPSHVPGWLPAGPRDDASLPHLPAKSGMSIRLRPARMSPASCVPPPYPEPTNLTDAGPAMSQLDSMRLVNPAAVRNTLVFDCLLQPPLLLPSAGAKGSEAAAGGAGDEESATGGEEDDRDASSSAADGGGGGRRRRAAVPSSLQRGSSGYASNASDSAMGVPAAAAGGQAGSGPSAAATADFSSQDSASTDGTAAVEAAAAAAIAAVAAPVAATLPAADAASLEGASAAGPDALRHRYFSHLPPWYCPSSEEDSTLVFESRFESGNLRRVLQVYPNEYDLVLHPDINTRGHTQWFYFAVTNTRKGGKYKFNIINLVKDDSLYSSGMLPLVHSEKELAASGRGWLRAGQQVAYFRNNIMRGRRKRYYTLTFTLVLEHDYDVVHVAHCYPFTYTDLQRHLATIEEDPDRQHRLRREMLCTTLAGNCCDILTITTPNSSQEALKKRRGVIISGRVHPGESNASWMMKGVIDFLTGPSLDAKLLRDNFVFKIIPMLNPDGVIVGNYRCSLAGQDLNRVWNEPSRKLHPTIHAMKAFARQFMEEREVVLFCDLHGHSQKKGIFIYGCEKGIKDLAPALPGWPVPGSHGGLPIMPMRFQDKAFPLLLHHNYPDLFSYTSSNFRVQKSKGGTGRVVGFKELGLTNSFTLEASFCGAAVGRWAGQHFNTWHLEQMGAGVVLTLLDYWDPEGYGIQDLLAEMDFMHPAGAEGTRRKFITTPDGQLIEVDEDDDPPTDSDDSDSDPEARAVRRQQKQPRQRAAPVGNGYGPSWLEQQQGGGVPSAHLLHFVTAAGTSPGGGQPLIPGSHSAGTAADWRQLAAAGGGTGAGDRFSGLNQAEIASAAAAAAAATTKAARRKSAHLLNKALLKAEHMKASEGLLECLPMIGSRDTEGPLSAHSDAPGEMMAAGAGGSQPGATSPALAGGGGGGASVSGLIGAYASSRAATAGRRERVDPIEALRRQAMELEYAKQRGIYRGDEMSWANTGMSVLPVPTSPSAPLTPSQPPADRDPQLVKPAAVQLHGYPPTPGAGRPPLPSEAGISRPRGHGVAQLPPAPSADLSIAPFDASSAAAAAAASSPARTRNSRRLHGGASSSVPTALEMPPTAAAAPVGSDSPSMLRLEQASIVEHLSNSALLGA